MIRLFVFLFLLFSTTTNANATVEQTCPAFKTPNVTVTPLVYPPRLDPTRSLASLRAMALSGTPDKVSSGQHEIPVGLTASNLRLATNYQITTTISPNVHTVCAQISAFALSLGFENTTVYVANEISSNSCSYQAVLDHEFKHVRTDEMIARYYAQESLSTLRKKIQEIGVVKARSAAEAEERIGALISRYIDELSSVISRARQERQQTIDTKEEYARLGQSCDGEMAEFLSRFLP